MSAVKRPAAVRPGARLELEIERLAFGGRGVAHHEGFVVFVTGVAPGDRVQALVERVHKRHAEASLAGLLVPSPLRVSPPCPLFEDCGGCQLMHLTAQAQIEAKTRFLEDALTRVGKLRSLAALAVPLEVRPAATRIGYRHRAALTCQVYRGEVAIGYFRESSHTLVDVPHCLVLAPVLDAWLARLRTELQGPGDPGNPGNLQARLELAADPTGRVAVRIQIQRGRPDAFETILEDHVAAGHLASARVDDENGALLSQIGPEHVLAAPLELPGLTDPVLFPLAPGSFSQVHLEQNRELVRQVLELAAAGPETAVLDVYAGSGNYSLALAATGVPVTSIESNPDAVEAARHGARTRGLPTLEILEGDAAGIVDELAGQGRRFPVVILNPPRCGTRNLLARLLPLEPRRIVYVSCDPATLARDLAELEARGYRLAWIRGFDMFPQTYHLETVALVVPDPASGFAQE